MGHLTRSITLLKKLSQNNKVYFLGSQDQIDFLKRENLKLDFQLFPDYNFNFKGRSFFVEMLFHSPRMILDIQNEQKTLKDLHSKFNFDLIISDNRFGFRMDEVKSVILTHQLKIKSPLMESQGSKLNQIYLNKFDEIWIPDTENSDYAGELSKAEINTHKIYLGNISDLNLEDKEKQFDYFVIGSGPEPYRGNFIELLLNQLKGKNLKVVFTGMKDIPKYSEEGFKFHVSLNRNEIQDMMNSSKTVITRAGYTSILDLDKTKSKAILIPTKGQYEQEYLAEHLKNHPRFDFQTEDEFQLID